MSRVQQGQQKKNFTNGKNNILIKGDELWLLCGVDIYIFLHRKGKYYTYKSTNQPSWPPPLETIVRTLETCFYMMYRILKYTQDQSYPLPIKKTPAEFDQGWKSEHER